MTNTTQSANEFSTPTGTFERSYGEAESATSSFRCRVFDFNDYAEPRDQAPARFTSVSDLVAEWEDDEDGRAALEAGRRWVADTFHEADGETVRTMRLRKGWSQARLAEALGTSQPHIARIERGSENVTIQTCRKLAEALDIDINRLDQALRLQEALLAAKQS